MIASIVLAAGSSTRMGYPKALLKIGGVTFLDRVLAAHQAIGLPVFVVLGAHQDQIKAAVDLSKVTVLVNPKPELGQLSSLKIGLRSAKLSEGVLVHPVDHPLVQRETLLTLVARRAENPSHILIPSYDDRRGHPVFFARCFFQELLDAPLEEGARFVVHQHPESVTLVPVSDPGVVENIDTPEDYERVRGAS